MVILYVWLPMIVINFYGELYYNTGANLLPCKVYNIATSTPTLCPLPRMYGQ